MKSLFDQERVLFAVIMLIIGLALPPGGFGHIIFQRSLFLLPGVNGEDPPAEFGGYGAPLVMDVNGDGFKEIYVEDTGGNRWILNHNALPLTPPLPVQVLQGTGLLGTGGAADLTGDGLLDIVVSREIGEALHPDDHRGVLQAFDRGVNLLFNRGPGEGLRSTIWPPTLADLDGDCVPEIIINDSHNILRVLDRTGRPFPGWPVELPRGAMFDDVAVGDLDGNGELEIVLTDQTPEVKIYSSAGREVITFETGGQLISSSPALGDLDGDGELEIVVTNVFDNRVYAWNADGSFVGGDRAQWPVAADGALGLNAPSLGDIDGDGRPEILAVSRDGILYAWNHDGTLVDGNGDGRVDFPVSFGGVEERVNFYVVPIVAEIDGKAGMEILVSTMSDRIYAFHHNGTPVHDFPLELPPSSAWAEPGIVVCDIDGDGWQAELVIARGNEVRVYRTLGRADDIEWGSRNHDCQNTRNYHFQPGPCEPIPPDEPADPGDWESGEPLIDSKAVSPWKRIGDGVIAETKYHPYIQ